MVGPQPLNRPGAKGNVESPLGSTRYATPRRSQWLGWLIRVEARRVMYDQQICVQAQFDAHVEWWVGQRKIQSSIGWL